jgi:hypothetical protein
MGDISSPIRRPVSSTRIEVIPTSALPNIIPNKIKGHNTVPTEENK